METQPKEMNEQQGEPKGQGFYLFCLARSFSPTDPWESSLDDRHPVFTKSFGEVTAVMSTVDLEEFCGQGAEERMKSLEWIGPRACSHEAVIDQVLRGGPVLPARFGTLFSTMDLLEELIESNRDAVLDFLENVEDKDECSVKGMIDREAAIEKRLAAVMAEQADSLASMSKGKRYFQEQRIQAGAEKELNGWLRSVCKEFADDLRDLATDICRRKVLSREATGEDRDMILNWAILVPRSALDGFRARIDGANREHGGQGLEFEISGPWPAYSFSPDLEIESDS